MSPEAVSAPDDDLDDDSRSGPGQKLRRALAVPGRLLAALFLPDRGMPAEVGAGRYGAALTAVILCGLIAAAAIGLRLDVSTDILAQAAAGPQAGAEARGGGNGGAQNAPDQTQATATKSDREITEDIDKTLGVERVMRGLKAGLLVPLRLAFLALLLFLFLRYVGGKPTLERSFAATTHAALPMGVKSLIVAGAALAQTQLTPAQADSLVGNPLAPTYAGLGPVAERMLQGVDPFMLWSLLLLGLGMVAAGEVSRRRAFITLFVGFALYLALVNGMGGGPVGPPPPHP